METIKAISDKEQRTKEINEAEKVVRITEELRNEAITKRKFYQESLKEKEDILKEYGTNINEADAKLSQLQAEYDEDLKFVNDNLPIDLLKKWGKI